MKIGFSGSAGTGKTTLARALAAHLGLPYIAEGMRTYLEGGGDIHMLGRAGLGALVLRLWGEQQEAEDRLGAFVADRCAHDFAAFWTYYGYLGELGTERIRGECLALRYDHVVLLPWGVIPLQADGVRSSNALVQLHVQTLIEGTLSMAGVQPLRVREYTVESRLAEVLAGLR